MGKSTRWLLSLLGLKKSSKSGGEKKPSAGKPEEPRKSTKEKRRWSFGKAQDSLEHSVSKADYEQEQTKHAIAVAAASAAAAEAAVAAAQAAAAVVRLTTQSNNNNGPPGPVFELISPEEWAAVKVQTAFRGYLARRALRALKAVVRIQALFRGHRVRKQAAITLRCMQALVRVQARVRARRVRMSQEGLAVQEQLLQRRLKDQGRSRKSVDGWNATTGTVEDLNAKNQRKFQGAMKRERALAYALSKSAKQGGATGMVIDCEPDTPHWGWSWLERWMAARPWESPFDGLADQTSPASGSTKIVEMDSGKPSTKQQQRVRQKKNWVLEPEPKQQQQHSSLASSIATGGHQLSQFASSPAAPSHHHHHHHHPRSSDNLDMEEYPGMSMTTTAGLLTEDEATNVKGSPAYSLKPLKQQQQQREQQQQAREESDVLSSFPSYMATTQSSKAKVRSHSTPKQRPEGWNIPETPRSSSRRNSIPLQLFHGGFESRSTNSGAPIRRAIGLRSAGGSVVFDRSIASLRDISANGDLRKPFRF